MGIQGLTQGCVGQVGIEKLSNLRVLYLSNNKLKDWAEIERLSQIESLEELLMVGNPLYNDYKDASNLAEYRIEVCCLHCKCASLAELTQASGLRRCLGGCRA